MKKPERRGSADSLPRGPKQSAAPHAVRIISGKWRRTLLPVLDAKGLRPTPNRVRETVFNWIAHFRPEGLEGARVLDLFAGSGALGLEAASRGALEVTLIDSSADVVECLDATLRRLKAEGVLTKRRDALSFLEEAGRAGLQFDLIFLDPPFHAQWLERIVGPAAELLSARGMVYIEAEAPLADTLLERYALASLRKDKAGQVVYYLLRRNIAAAGQSPTNSGDAAC
jgi:16S rRNA (guanine(966)-N(2))-methyltransferase RsmD